MDIKSLLNNMIGTKHDDSLLKVTLGKHSTCACYSRNDNFFDDIISGKEIEIKPLFSFNSEGSEYEKELINKSHLSNRDYYYKQELISFEKLNDTRKIYYDNSLFILCNSNVYENLLKHLESKEYIYLSFVSLNYYSLNETGTLTTPLLYIKCKVTNKENNKYTIKSLSSNVSFNSCLIEYILYEHNIDLTYDYQNFDFDEFCKAISQKAKENNMTITKEMFISSVTFDYLNLVKSYYEKLEENYKEPNTFLKGINEPIFDLANKYSVRNNLENIISRQGNFYVSPYNTLKEFISKYKIAKLDIDDKPFGNEILNSFTKRLLNKKRSILYIEPNYKKCLEKRNELEDFGFNGLLNPKSPDHIDYPLFKAFSDSEKLSKTNSLTQKEKEQLVSFNKIKEEYIQKRIQEKKKLSKCLGDTYINAVNKATECLSKCNFLFEIDTNCYTLEDRTKDEQFINNIKKYDSLLNCIFKELPFYGITSKLNESNFEDIKVSCASLKLKISDFISFVEKNNLNTLGVGLLNSIEHIRFSIDLIYILLKYNGFDKKYFDIVLNPDVKIKINELEELFDLVREERSNLNPYFKDQSFLQEQNVGKIYYDIVYKTKERKQSKKLLKKAIISKPVIFKKVLKELPTYIELNNNFNKKLLEYEDTFGYGLYDIDGVSKVKKSFEYASEFLQTKEQYKDVEGFNFDSDFVNKFIDNPELRSQVKVELVPLLEEKYNELINAVNLYKSYFVDDELVYTETFDVLLQSLDNKYDAKYKDYIDYSSYMNDLTNTSDTFKEFHKTYSDKHLPIKCIEEYFFASLYKSISNKLYNYMYNENTLECQNFIQLKSNYLINLSLLSNVLNKDETKYIVDNRIRYFNSDEYKEIFKQLRYTFLYNKVPNIKKILDALNETYLNVFPITVETLDKLKYFEKVHFDYVVIDDTNKFTDEEITFLLSVLDKSKIIMVSYRDSIDKRFNLYPTIKVNYESLLAYPYQYNKLSDSFILKLSDIANKEGYYFISNITTRDISKPPLGLTSKNNDEFKFVIIPDCLYEEYEVETIEYNLRRFFNKTNKVNVFTISSLLSVFDSQKAFDFSMNVNKESVNQIKSNELIIEKEEEKEEKDSLEEITLRYGSKEDFEKRISKLQSQFKISLSLVEISDLVKKGEYNKVLEYTLPCKLIKLTELEDEEFNKYLRELFEKRILIRRGDTVYFYDMDKNEFKISKFRDIKEVDSLEIINYIKIYLRNFAFIPLGKIKSLCASSLSVDINNEEFINKFNYSVNFLVRTKRYVLQDDNLINVM